jgi:uncharacterized protein (DUF1778 family)
LSLFVAVFVTMDVSKGVRMATLATRVNAEEEKLIREFAAVERRSIAEVLRHAILDRIEDSHDLAVLEAAIAAHEKNPTTYSTEEVIAELGRADG